jgi:hypothetical protein
VRKMDDKLDLLKQYRDSRKILLPYEPLTDLLTWAIEQIEQRRVAVTDEGEQIGVKEALWRLDDICFLGDDPTGRDRKALELAITALEQKTRCDDLLELAGKMRVMDLVNENHRLHQTIRYMEAEKNVALRHSLEQHQPVASADVPIQLLNMFNLSLDDMVLNNWFDFHISRDDAKLIHAALSRMTEPEPCDNPCKNPCLWDDCTLCLEWNEKDKKEG